MWIKSYLKALKNFSFKDSSLLIKQIICFLVIAIIPLAITNLIWFKTTTKILEDHSVQSTSLILKQVNQNIKNSLEEINNISLSILFDLEINELLTINPESIHDKIKLKNALKEKLMRIENTSNKIAGISIIGNEMDFSSTSMPTIYENLKERDWYKSFTEKKPQKLYTRVHYNDYFSDTNHIRPVFSYLRTIRDVENNKIGILVIDIKYEVIEEIFTELQQGEKSYFIVYDMEGNLVYHPDINKIFDYSNQDKQLFNNLTENKGIIKTVFNNKNSLVYYDTMPYTNWKIVNIIPRDILMSESLKVKKNTQLLGALFLIIVVLVAFFLSLYISKPIIELVKRMKWVERGDLSIRVDVNNSKDEVGQLGLGFNNMLDKINQLIHKVYQEQEKKREVELKALQAQINPHFLYNTLNTIRWMAVIQKAENINQMIIALIKLLEFSGKRIGEFVSIEHELEHVKNYIFLQKIRYNDKFKVIYEIDEQALQYKTIKFILQPIVENAIYHGIEPKKGIGTIKITLSKIEDKLRFQIIDDGVGMYEVMDHNRNFSGLGIENVNERLIKNFGEVSELKIFSKVNEGTKVEFYLPIMEDESMVNKDA